MAQDVNHFVTDFLRREDLHGEGVNRPVRSILNWIGDALMNRGSVMPGAHYQELRSDIARTARNAGDNNTLREHLTDVNRILDSAMERSIGRQGGDVAAFQSLNSDYRKALVIEKAAGRQRSARKGFLTPSALQSSAESIYGKRTYERGRYPFSEVTTPAGAVLKNLPDSGTAQRANAFNAVNALSHFLAAGGGALLGHHIGGGGGGGGGVGDVLGAILGESGAASANLLGHSLFSGGS